MRNLIYVTEDDANIREMLTMALCGFSYEVRAFESAEETLLACGEEVPSLFIFDIMLPGMDGVSAVRYLRGNPNNLNRPELQSVPVLLLTAMDTEIDKVRGLDAGADDYLAKPFGILELGARVRALLRRNTANPKSSGGDDNPADDSSVKDEPDGLQMSGRLRFFGLTVDIEAREVLRDSGEVKLTFKEFELLMCLIRNKNRVVSREELLDSVWGYSYQGETRTLDVHIKSLRHKLCTENNSYIKTVRNVGYRFVGKPER
ncbi:DNA-binding response regulator [Clostridia bacterium]|nr:DNA-binding response regulator [Clostridia bacterium]